VANVETSKAPSRVKHSEERDWSPYPLGKVEPTGPSFVGRQVEAIIGAKFVPQFPEYPALKSARLVPRDPAGGVRW
jgi:hypothetical protein